MQGKNVYCHGSALHTGVRFGVQAALENMEINLSQQGNPEQGPRLHRKRESLVMTKSIS